MKFIFLCFYEDICFFTLINIGFQLFYDATALICFLHWVIPRFFVFIRSLNFVCSPLNSKYSIPFYFIFSTGRKDDLVQRLMQYDESESENSIQTENKMISSNSTEDNKENVENLENVGNKPIIKMKLLGLGKNTFGLLNSLQEEDMVEKEIEWF